MRVFAIGLGLFLVAVLASCGGDDDGPGPDPDASHKSSELGAVLNVAGIERRDAGIVITWRVRNDGDADLVVFDGGRPDLPDGSLLHDAFVIAHDGQDGYDGDGDRDGIAEISRRLFGLEDPDSVQQYGISATLLPVGKTLEGRDLVDLPLEYAPAASGDGTEPPPGDTADAIFCIGVGPAEEFTGSGDDTSPPSRFVVDDRSNADNQTLLCGQPFPLAAT